MHRPDVILQRFGRRDVLDSERNDRQPLLKPVLHFPADLGRVVGVPGKNQNKDLRFVDGVDDRLAPVGAGLDIARGDPAPDAVNLQRRANSVGSRLVLRRVTNK